MSGVTADLQYPNPTNTGSVFRFSKFFFEFVNSTSTAKQASLILCQLSVNWLYVAFCNRIFNFSLVLSFMEWRRGSQVIMLLGVSSL